MCRNAETDPLSEDTHCINRQDSLITCCNPSYRWSSNTLEAHASGRGRPSNARLRSTRMLQADGRRATGSLRICEYRGFGCGEALELRGPRCEPGMWCTLSWLEVPDRQDSRGGFFFRRLSWRTSEMENRLPRSKQWSATRFKMRNAAGTLTYEKSRKLEQARPAGPHN